MSCFPCFKKKSASPPKEEVTVARPRGISTTPPPNSAETFQRGDKVNPVENGNCKSFTFRELASATRNFKQECLIGEGGFGRVFKGTLQGGEVVAVKQLDRSGTQGNQEFLVEVSKLSHLKHPNLVNLIGYCGDGDQRILVFEYMPLGCLEDHLLDIEEDKAPLDWLSRMKIALGAANGLEYLHEKTDPPIIYRDMKSTNILLDKDFNPKLTDYGLAKLGGAGSRTTMSPMMIGNGYCAPEFERNGELTLKSDVYCFGIVLLELITGRRAVDTTRPIDEQHLVSWAQPYFKDPKRFPELADPHLGKHFPLKSLNQAVGVTAMCLQEEPMVRPLISDVVAALSFLAIPLPDDPPPASPSPPPPTSNIEKSSPSNESDDEDEDYSDDEYEYSESDQENDEKLHVKQRSQKVSNKRQSKRIQSQASSDFGYGSASGSEYEDGGDEEQRKMAAKSAKYGSRSRYKSKVKSRARSINSGLSS